MVFRAMCPAWPGTDSPQPTQPGGPPDSAHALPWPQLPLGGSGVPGEELVGVYWGERGRQTSTAGAELGGEGEGEGMSGLPCRCGAVGARRPGPVFNVTWRKPSERRIRATTSPF